MADSDCHLEKPLRSPFGDGRRPCTVQEQFYRIVTSDGPKDTSILDGSKHDSEAGVNRVK